MKLLALPLAIAGLVLALLLGGPIAERWRDRNEYQAALERIELSDRAYQTEATAATRAASSNTMQIFLLVGIGAAGWALFDMYRQRRAPIVRVNGLPIARQLITSDDDRELIGILAERIRLAGIAQIEEARRPLVPASLSYSPKITTLDAEQPAPAAQPLLVDSAPDVVMPREKWLRWLDEQPHTLLGGRTRAGKTTLATAILAERLKAREQVFIIDPHASGWLGLPTAGSAANNGELARALGAVLGEYITRMQARDKHKRETGQELPHDHFGRLNILVDEANGIADELRAEWKTVCRQLASGSRKVGISLLVMAQSPLVEDLGISGAMRENFARLALDDRGVQLLIDGERDKARKDALRAALRGVERPAAAQIGAQVWLLDRSDLSAGSPPRDAQKLVWRGWDFAAGRRAAVTSSAPNGNDVTSPGNENVTALESAETLDGNDVTNVTISPAEVARIAALLASLSPSEVVKKLDGYSPRRYAEYKARVDYVVNLMGVTR